MLKWLCHILAFRMLKGEKLQSYSNLARFKSYKKNIIILIPVMQLFKFVEFKLEKWLHCKFCERKFGSKIELICHLQMEENYSESVNICKSCHVALYSAAEFQDHVISRHPNDRSLCLICEAPVKHQCNYLRHVASHFPEKPYKCGSCGNHFKRKDKMKLHERKCAWQK